MESPILIQKSVELQRTSHHYMGLSLRCVGYLVDCSANRSPLLQIILCSHSAEPHVVFSQLLITYLLLKQVLKLTLFIQLHIQITLILIWGGVSFRHLLALNTPSFTFFA